MAGPFPKAIRKVGIFPLSFGFQGEKYIATFRERFAGWKVNYVMPEPATPEFRYMAATDEERARIFNSLLADESVDFLFALRGGFGAARTLPFIDWNMLLRRNIPVAGYSDMTAFIAAALSKGFKNGICGVMAESTFGTPNVSRRRLSQAVKAMRNCIEGKVISVPFNGKYTTLRTGCVKAPIMAGNLAVLEALIGTAWMPDLTGHVLVLEGIAQNAVDVDRALTHFRDCGILKSLAGLVFGTFSSCKDPEFLPELFREYSSCQSGPSFYGLPFGHEFPAAAIRIGVETEISVGEGGKVLF